MKLTLTAISLADRRQLWQTTITRVGLDTNYFNSLSDPPEFEVEPLGPNGDLRLPRRFGKSILPRRSRQTSNPVRPNLPYSMSQPASCGGKCR